MTKFYLFLVFALCSLLSLAAHAGKSQADLLRDATPVDGAGGEINLSTSDYCDLDELKALRFKAREAFALRVARTIPKLPIYSPVEGVSCLKKPAAFNAVYFDENDSFTLTCLGRKKNNITHLLTVRLKEEPANCPSENEMSEWVDTDDGFCNIPSSEIAMKLSACNPPVYGIKVAEDLGDFKAYNFDENKKLWKNEFKRKGVSNIVKEDRTVKGAKVTDEPAPVEDCDTSNPFGCAPSSTDAQ